MPSPRTANSATLLPAPLLGSIFPGGCLLQPEQQQQGLESPQQGRYNSLPNFTLPCLINAYPLTYP